MKNSLKEQSLITTEDIAKVLKFVGRNIGFLLILPLIGLLIGFLYSHRLQEVYAAKGQILLNSGDVYDYQQNLFQGLGMENNYYSYDKIESDKRVLSSTKLINEALDQLNFEVTYFIIGRIKTTEVFNNIPFKVNLDNHGKGTYAREFEYRFIDEETFELGYLQNDEITYKTYRFKEQIIDYGFNFSVEPVIDITKENLAGFKEIRYRFRVGTRGELISKYKRDLSVTSLEWTSILELTVRDVISERAELFIETLSTSYIEYTLENKRAKQEYS